MNPEANNAVKPFAVLFRSELGERWGANTSPTD
jgi:hypothetical protein